MIFLKLLGVLKKHVGLILKIQFGLEPLEFGLLVKLKSKPTKLKVMIYTLICIES